MRKTTYIRRDSLQKRETCSQKTEQTTNIRGDSSQKRETCSQNRETTFIREGRTQKRVEEDYLYKMG